jgi:hypothetical protein
MQTSLVTRSGEGNKGRLGEYLQEATAFPLVVETQNISAWKADGSRDAVATPRLRWARHEG